MSAAARGAGVDLNAAWRDTECEVTTAAKVEECGEHWNVQRADGWSFFVPKVEGAAPRVGSVLRFWGGGIGRPVRGLAVDGVVLFYETADEMTARYKREAEERERERRESFEREGRAKLDAKYAALPPVFQQRLDRFRGNNPEFRWQYEDYEMFCCEQAVVIADALKSPEAVRAFKGLPWAEQLKAVPGLSEDHSGNTFGAACALAHWYLEQPENVVALHGALAPLVGSAEYGCTPATPTAAGAEGRGHG